jgi:hypothetical protein
LVPVAYDLIVDRTLLSDTSSKRPLKVTFRLPQDLPPTSTT